MDYLKYWSLLAPPFGRHAALGFFAGAPQREALARLQTLIASELSSGLLLSPSGCGLTTLLKQIAGSRGLGDCAVEMLLTRGDQTEPAQVWRDLADALRLGPRSRDLPGQIQAVIEAGSRQSVRTVWLIDRAGPTATTIARELLDHDRRFSVVMGTDPPRAHWLAISLGHCPLRIELAEWSLGDTMDFIPAALRSSGGRQPIFADTAIVRLHEIGEGRVGMITGLAELALVVAAAHQLRSVGPDLIESVQEELVRAA